MKEGSQPVSFESADAECRWLREENARLRQLLTEHNIRIPPAELRASLASRLSKYCPLRIGKNEPARESRYFGASSAGERTSTRDDGKARMAARDIHRRSRRTGRQLTGVGRRTERKLIKKVFPVDRRGD
jgi:hypothetical protein